MKKIVIKISKYLQSIEDWCENIAYFALWGIVFLIFFQVLFRNFLNIGLSWPDEIARYFHILIVFLCLGYVTRENRHIRIDFLRKRFTGVFSKLFFLFIQFFSSAILVFGGIEIISRIGHLRTPAANMPVFLFFLPPVIGFSMIMLDSIRKLQPSSQSDPKSEEGNKS